MGKCRTSPASSKQEYWYFNMKRITTFFIMLWVVSVCAAQVTFVVKSPQTVDVNGQFRVQYVLSNAEGEEFSKPSFPDFEVLAGPSVSNFSNFQIINGKRSSSSSITYTYILQPKHKGTFSLPIATIKAGGKVYKSQNMKVNVISSASAGASTSSSNSRIQSSDDDDDDFFTEPQHAGSAITNRDLYFTVGATKKRVYEQEPIMLTYKFHARVGVGLANVMLRQKPDLKGFWTQEIELPRNLAPSSEKQNGALYRVGTNLQYVIFPQQTGKLTIPGITFDCDVIQRDRQIDPLDAFFNGGGNINMKVQRTTDDITIEVLPLPQPKPAAFSGGVGHFALKTQLTTQVPKTNDIASLRLTISGNGNMKLIKAPIVAFPKDFDTYEAKMTDKTKVSGDGITGEVYFDYTFVPRNIGEYDIPAADFVYFDTQKQEYVTLHTQPIHLKVEKGKRSKEDVEAELAMRNSDIHDVHINELSYIAGFSTSSASWIGSLRYFFCHLLIVILGCATLLWFKKREEKNSDIAGKRSRKAQKKANKHIREAEKALATGDHSTFYSALSTALRSYFGDKLSQESASLTNESIVRALEERQLPAEVVDDVRQLLEDCDYARFAPSADASQRENDLTRASNVIDRIEFQLKK